MRYVIGAWMCRCVRSDGGGEGADPVRRYLYQIYIILFTTPTVHLLLLLYLSLVTTMEKNDDD